MRGKISFDISNDSDIMDMAAWFNDHKDFDIKMSYDGRFIHLEFYRNSNDRTDAIRAERS